MKPRNGPPPRPRTAASTSHSDLGPFWVGVSRSLLWFRVQGLGFRVYAGSRLGMQASAGAGSMYPNSIYFGPKP